MARSLRHWTPRYVWNRAKVLAWEHRNPDAPWLTQEAVRLLSSLVKPTDRVLEWGSGRSTRWFAQRVATLTSVEHDPAWYQRVSGWIAGRENVSYFLRPCSDTPADAGGAAYFGVAETMPDESVDVALVDGILRDECAVRVIGKVARGGLLVVDNANWYLPSASHAPNSRRFEDGEPFASAVWAAIADRLSHWRSIWTTNGVTDTAIWIRGGS